MASISTTAAGNRSIQFTNRDRRRKTIYLGVMPMKFVETIKGHVEKLNFAAITGHSVETETARWLTTISPILANKLAKVGLIAPREVAKLGPFLESYIKSRSDVKRASEVAYRQTQRWLLKHFGADRLLTDILPGHADEFRLWLLGQVGDNTTRRHCGRAKQFFRAALRKRLIDANPFEDMRGCAVRANRTRDHLISLEETQKVLDACPDAQWRLLFALSRFGGLRCPSEHVALTWGDVNWAENKITVHSPKTEHHEGKESRIIPIFPELRPYLEAAFEEAEPGTTHVITIRRTANANLRTRLRKIIKRAGLKPWPKLFHNLRASRQTELAQRFPMHVVCEWIGNSQVVAIKHYLRVTDADYAAAASDPTPNAASGIGGDSDQVASSRAEPAEGDERNSEPDMVLASNDASPSSSTESRSSLLAAAQPALA